MYWNSMSIKADRLVSRPVTEIYAITLFPFTAGAKGQGSHYTTNKMRKVTHLHYQDSVWIADWLIDPRTSGEEPSAAYWGFNKLKAVGTYPVTILYDAYFN